MKPEVMLELLESAAEQLKVRVSYEPLQTSVVHGGLCKVKGEYRIIVDKRATAEERVNTVAAALAKVAKHPTLAAFIGELSPKVLEVLRMHDDSPARPAAAPARPKAPAPGRRTVA